MADDIVTQLRESLEMIHPDPQDVRDAIKEIERLREAGDALAHGIRTGKWDDALDAWTEVRGE